MVPLYANFFLARFKFVIKIKPRVKNFTNIKIRNFSHYFTQISIFLFDFSRRKNEKSLKFKSYRESGRSTSQDWTACRSLRRAGIE